MTSRAIAVSTYNRAAHIGEVLEGIMSTKPNDADVFVCDDGSTDGTINEVLEFPHVKLYSAENLGVGANKTRCLYLMKNHHFSCILEDDLVPTDKLWFETYEAASTLMDVHHWCRIQDKEIPETLPSFTEYMKKTMNATPIYASSPRGDLTFITRKVISTVGGMNPLFEGVGFAHGEWSGRVAKAGLISHPLNWIDIAEARDKFKQVGDTEGGRWEDDPEEIQKQIKRNRNVAKALEHGGEPIYCPLRIT
jgi:glycosyltransferase involved in cell wall biosynthesis